MPTPEDALFGRIAIHMHLAAQEHVAFCLQLQAHDQAAGQPRRSLGQIMVERGYITPPQVNLILEEQKRRGGPKMIGPYEVVGKLGEGGMGAVYRARVPQTGAEVALKVLPRKHADNAAFISRFDREARIGMELEHPNIVRTLDMGEDHGVHFMALEVVEGGDVRKLLKERNILTESEALGIARDVAFALQYAHERGLVHRDVKPANIMFDREGRTRLSDFGLVKQTDPEASHLTQTGYMVGTAHYIAPEQARGQKDVDIRADIYALGATLYHMVTGQTPFSGDTPMAVMAKHLSEELTAPDEINPSLGDGCVSLIEKMMAKDREDRYATPGDAAYDMECVLRGEEPEGATLGEGSSSVKVSPKRQARVRQRFEAIKARPERPRGRTRTSQQKIVPPERGGTPGRGIPARRSSAQIVPLEVPRNRKRGSFPSAKSPLAVWNPSTPYA
ncbi:MAG: serine/threonine protein kinase [Planctomycetota bacterium]|nr:serine/threonine protein kinase [Planctomycetota bacterium]